MGHLALLGPGSLDMEVKALGELLPKALFGSEAR